MSFTCPKCWRTSYSAEDEQWGYCGNCHDFTGAIQNGIQRYSSGSVTARSEGEMRMQPDNEEPEAQPEMSEMQGERISGSLRDMPWERMERDYQQDMQAMRGIGVSTASDPQLITLRGYPLTSRDALAFISVGISCGLSLGSLLYFWMTRSHAVRTSTAIIVVIAIYQTAFMLLARRRMKRSKRRLDEMQEIFTKLHKL